VHFGPPTSATAQKLWGPNTSHQWAYAHVLTKNENDHLPERYPLNCFDDSHAYVGTQERLRTHLHAEGEVESAAVQEASSNFGAGDILVDEFLGQVAGYVSN